MSNEDLAKDNYDIRVRQEVGFGFVQKTNVFHKVEQKEQEFTIEHTDPLADQARQYTFQNEMEKDYDPV